MEIIENQSFDEERALYGRTGLDVRNCRFDGPADGESAFKECSAIAVADCLFNLRYPFWHNHGLSIDGCDMTENCRAALWYSEHVRIADTRMHGIKAIRECSDVRVEHCDIISPEFGWSTRGIHMQDCTANSMYFLMRSTDVDLSDVDFEGKYSFQYVENATLSRCHLKTKDAFWHARNVTVEDSLVEGEYLGWYSDGLTLVNCTIVGTQPFCYCKNLKLVNCKMEDTDLCFEKSDVDATVTTPVLSIKNPHAGTIRVPAVGEIIRDDPRAKANIVIGRKDIACAACA